MIATRRRAFVVLAAAFLAAGCGGSDVTANQRIERCLDKQPDATESDCKKWESDGQLNDDGKHQGHENM